MNVRAVLAGVARRVNPDGLSQDEGPVTVPVLSVTPSDSTQGQLEQALRQSQTVSNFTVERCKTLDCAAERVSHGAFPVVICDRDLESKSWKDLLHALPEARPSLIVTSRLADEYLWAEALNLGAYDVLAQPFHPDEVSRVLQNAWIHWKTRLSGDRAGSGTAR